MLKRLVVASRHGHRTGKVIPDISLVFFACLLDCFAEQLLCFAKPSFMTEGHGQRCEAVQSLGMLGTQYAAPDLEYLAVERLGLRVLALVVAGIGQIAHVLQRIGMFGAQNAALDLHGLAKKCLSLRVFSLQVVIEAEVICAGQCVGVLRTQYAAPDLEDLAVERLGLRVLVRIPVGGGKVDRKSTRLNSSHLGIS